MQLHADYLSGSSESGVVLTNDLSIVILRYGRVGLQYGGGCMMAGFPSSKYTRRDFLARLGTAAAGLAVAPRVLGQEPETARTNVLLITVDDMNFDSAGVTGCKIPGITPSIDKLAAQGMRFEHAHVTSAVCQPSRSVLMTGRYPHRNGAMGFEPIDPSVPTLQESLREAGYLNGIMAKVGHLAPQAKFCWDTVVGANDLGQGRDPALFYSHSKAFFEQAKAAGKPFFLMANSQDPHRPFPGSDGEANRKAAGLPEVSRTYKPEEVPVPGFLPDGIPDIRVELAQYFAGVHRCDEAVGQVLRALKEAGLEENTIVFFLSDNGMSFPYAKTNCYRSSTATPMIVRWPGKIKPNTVNRHDFVSGIDFMPTVLDVFGMQMLEGMDGRSFLPLLKGKRQGGRDKVFTFFTETSAKNKYPMRCVRTEKFSYIFNAWADGQTIFRNEPQSGLTFKAMQTAAEHDDAIAERVKFFLFRTKEEFYDLEADPCEMENLINAEEHKATIQKMRRELLEMMVSTKDPLLEVFKKQAG